MSICGNNTSVCTTCPEKHSSIEMTRRGIEAKLQLQWMTVVVGEGKLVLCGIVRCLSHCTPHCIIKKTQKTLRCLFTCNVPVLTVLGLTHQTSHYVCFIFYSVEIITPTPTHTHTQALKNDLRRSILAKYSEDDYKTDPWHIFSYLIPNLF